MKITKPVVRKLVDHVNQVLKTDIDLVGQYNYSTLEMNGGSRHLFSGSSRECYTYLRGMMDGLSIKRTGR